MVRDFCGHGLGRLFHDEPNILHYGRRGEGVALKPGMFFTIEPMINLGRPHVKVLADGWTAVTRDRSLSAQFEHTVAVTETGVEIFTLSPKGLDQPALSAAERPEMSEVLPEDAGHRRTTSDHRRSAARSVSSIWRRGAARLRAAGAPAVPLHSPPRRQGARQGDDRPVRLLRRGARGTARPG